MQNLLFYTTEGCHLCEQAELLLKEAQSLRPTSLESVDIATSADLVDRYGLRIPVVKKQSNNKELGWPFDMTMLLQFLADD